MGHEPTIGPTVVQVNLFCEDVAGAARFYAALGLPPVFAAPQEGPAEHVEIEVAGTRIGLTSISAARRIAHLDVAVQTAASTELVPCFALVSCRQLPSAPAVGTGAQLAGCR
ncbi:hypothetical protein [Actinotalea sp. K2]|uniref:hypothetical protein n=1 Tax=Actinotalea sp. K2 TaxID=2939438 RepID=UPI002017EE3A|nr:hypothetical protein [Actinotalea sp. K2]MCL3861201.1 hypothetical protein [Actinotalea sp. K2]